MLKRFKIASSVKFVAAAMVIFSLIAFVNAEHDGEICADILINIENQLNNYYVDEVDVLALINNNGQDVILGRSFDDIQLKRIEMSVKSSPYIRDAEVFKDLKGNLMVKTVLRRPVARIVSEQNADAYISEEGVLLPVSDKFTSRVVLVSGEGVEELLTTELSLKEALPEIFELINTVNADKFWKAQIAQIHVEKDGEVMLYPQVTKQYVEFGKAENIDNKFSRLKIFYKEVLPYKGWNSYKRVNLKYKDQIVAE